MSKKIYVWCLVLVVAFLVFPVANANANLLSNASFEDGTGDVADVWLYPTGTAVRSDEQAHSGEWSFKLTNTRAVSGYAAFVTQEIDISSYANGTVFTLGVWALNPSSNPLTSVEYSGIDILLGKYGSTGLVWTGADIVYGIDGSSSQDTWIYNEYTATKTDDATFIALYIALKAVDTGTAPGGTLYYDDIMIVPEPATIFLIGFGTLISLRKRGQVS